MDQRGSSSNQLYFKSILSPEQLVVQSLYLQCGVKVDTKTFLAIWKLCDLGIPPHAVLSLLHETAKYGLAKKWNTADLKTQRPSNKLPIIKNNLT